MSVGSIVGVMVGTSSFDVAVDSNADETLGRLLLDVIPTSGLGVPQYKLRNCEMTLDFILPDATKRDELISLLAIRTPQLLTIVDADNVAYQATGYLSGDKKSFMDGKAPIKLISRDVFTVMG